MCRPHNRRSRTLFSQSGKTSATIHSLPAFKCYSSKVSWLPSQGSLLPPQQGGLEKPSLVVFSEEEKKVLRNIAENNVIVSDLKEKLGAHDVFVEKNGIRLPLGVVGTVIYRGPEWDARVSVSVEKKDVISIQIEKHREKPPQMEPGNMVKMAEKNPQVAQRLQGKKYTTQLFPPTPQGAGHVAFIDEKTKKHLFLAEVDPQSNEVRIIEPQRSGGIEVWQIASLLLLVLLVAVMAYLYFSPKKKENQ